MGGVLILGSEGRLSVSDYATLMDMAEAHGRQIASVFVTAYRTDRQDELADAIVSAMKGTESATGEAAKWQLKEARALRLNRNFQQMIDAQLAEKLAIRRALVDDESRVIEKTISETIRERKQSQRRGTGMTDELAKKMAEMSAGCLLFEL